MATISTYDATLTAGAASATITSIIGSPATYRVTDIAGTQVASGSVSGASVTIPGWSGGTWLAGWYLVEFISATWSTATGYVTDSIQISVLRTGVANLPPVPAAGTSPNAADPGNTHIDQYMHGFCGMGPQRWQIHDAANPTVGTSDIGSTIAAIQANLTLDQGAAGQTNPTYADSARPRPEFVTFPNNPSSETGYAAGVASVVAAMGPSTGYGVQFFEGLNEPTGSNSLTPAQSAAQYNAFRAAVKAGDSAAKAMGPAEVAYPPNGSLFGSAANLTAWLAAITPGTLDAFSVHDYNAYNGDFLATDAWLGQLRACLTTAGYSSSLPVFLTETGNIVFQWGTYDPRRAIQWLAQLLHTAERWGIPKERIYWFFDYSNPGFAFSGDNSWIKEQTGDLRPHAVFYRVYSEEIYGKTYTSALDFGTPGNSYYRGNVYRGAGGTCVALMAQGNPGDTCTLAVSDAGPLTYSDWRGVTSTVTVTNGKVVVPIGDLPTYLRLSSAATVSVSDVGNGLAASPTNLAPAATASSGTGSANPGYVNDSVLQTGGYSASPPDGRGYVSTTLPDTITLTWGAAQSFDKVVIRQMPPWSNWYATAMTTGRLEYWNGSGWLPCPTVAKNHWNDVGIYNNTSATEHLGVIGGLSYLVNFWDHHWTHNIDFQAPITTTKLRWTITTCSIGHLPDENSAYYGKLQGNPRQVTCSEIQVFQIGTVPTVARYALAR